MAIATVGAPPMRRERTSESTERAQRPTQTDVRPEPLGPARGIVLALAGGALAWAFLIAALLRL